MTCTASALWLGSIPVDACTEPCPAQIEGGMFGTRTWRLTRRNVHAGLRPRGGREPQRHRAARPGPETETDPESERCFSGIAPKRWGRAQAGERRRQQRLPGRHMGAKAVALSCPCWVIVAVSQAHLCWDHAIVFPAILGRIDACPPSRGSAYTSLDRHWHI